MVLTWAEAGGAQKYVRGRSLDLSASGMRVELPQSIPVRTYVSLNIKSISQGVTASVRHCVASRGKYIVGLEFNCPIKTLAERLARESASSLPPVTEPSHSDKS